MTTRNLLAAGALALGPSLAAAATSAAYAQPSGKTAGYFPVLVAAIPANATTPTNTEQGGRKHASKGDCPMMKGDSAMRDQCMGMMTHHHDTPKTGALG